MTPLFSHSMFCTHPTAAAGRALVGAFALCWGVAALATPLPGIETKSDEAIDAPTDPLDAARHPNEKPTLIRPSNITQGASRSELAREERLFPRYPEIKPNIEFWKKVLGEYRSVQSVVHPAAYPGVTLKVLDFSDEAERMGPISLDRYREAEEKRVKDYYTALIEQVHAQRNNPAAMDRDQRRIYDLFSGIKDDNRFLKAAARIRTQRGLLDKTERAVEISRHYMPMMEATFKSYDLPVSLTRLPVVESSFNVEAYSKAGAAGLWQFIPSSARIYMRLNELVDDRRDPWISTDAAARHLRDDYEVLNNWPLAITAYNYGRGGIARALKSVDGATLVDIIERFESPRFGFASSNYYAEFVAALDVDRELRGSSGNADPLTFDVVETQHYVSYDTLRQLCEVDEDLFRKLNPSYRPEVMEGKIFVPPMHAIRVPAGMARKFETAYAALPPDQKLSSQRLYYAMHKIVRGDSLSRLAKNYGVSSSAIVAANNLDRKRTLRVGQTIKIPPRGAGASATVAVARAEPKAQPKKVVVASTDAAADTKKVKPVPPAATPTVAAKPKAVEPISKPTATVAAKPAVPVIASAATRPEPLTAPKTVTTFKPVLVGGADKTHTVRSGQTLDGIAKKYRVSVAALRNVNNLPENNVIKPGQKLKIPSAG